MQHQLTRRPNWDVESNSISNFSLSLQLAEPGQMPQGYAATSTNFDPSSWTAKLSTGLPELSPHGFKTSQTHGLQLINLLAQAVSEGIERALRMVVKKRVMQELLTLKEVERELKISRTTVWRLRKLGLIKTSAVGGIIRIHRRDLERFVSNELLAGRSR